MAKLTIRMALNFNHHLLETPDGLIAALLGHLLAKVVLGALLRLLLLLEGSLLVLLHLVLVLVRNVGICGLLQVVHCIRQTSLAGHLWIIGRVVLSIVLALLSGLLDVTSAERLVLGILILGLGPECTRIHVWDFVPCVLWCRLIDLAKAVLIRIDFGSCLLGGITSNIAQENASVAEKFSELAIGDDQCAQCAKAVQGLVAVLLGSVLVNRGTWNLCVAAIQVLGLPDEVLEEVTLILAQQQMLGLFDDIAEIGDQDTAFF